MIENDKNKTLLQPARIELNPANIFAKNGMKKFAKEFMPEGTNFQTNEDFFKLPHFTQNEDFSKIIEEMRTNLARNCTIEDEAEAREKNPILGLDPNEMVDQDQWTPDATLRKLK
jgi:hypothetical protein